MFTKLLIALIRVYQQTLSRLLLAAFGPVCRFEPSCSSYAVACLQGHGALRGSLLSARRLCKCHPFHPGGFDPPPPPRNGRAQPSQPPQASLPRAGGPQPARTPAAPVDGAHDRPALGSPERIHGTQ